MSTSTPRKANNTSQDKAEEETQEAKMDHIVANNHLLPKHKRSEIDKYGAHIAIGTSHHFNLWANFNLDLQWEQTKLSSVTRTKYSKIANIPTEIIRMDKGEVADIRHKTNLDKEELQKSQAHMALQKIRKILQDKDDIEMASIEQKIILFQQKTETRHLNKVK